MKLNEYFIPSKGYIILEAVQENTNGGIILSGTDDTQYYNFTVIGHHPDSLFKVGDKVEIKPKAHAYELSYRFSKFKTQRDSKLVQLVEPEILGVFLNINKDAS